MILASVEPLAQGFIASQTRQRNETIWTLKACTAEQMTGLCHALKGHGAFLIAVGACGCSGGGVDRLLPVDVYIPGCPPRPQALLHGLLMAMGQAEERLGV